MIRVAREIIGYTMTFFGQTQVEKKIVSLSHLKEEVRKIIGSSRAIVQQGLDLVTHNGAIVDLRPLVQKNGQGEWQVTAIPVRVGVRGAHITSTRTGSQVYDFTYFFEMMLGYSKGRSQELQARIKELLGRIVARLEEEFGPFGELGIDLALDKEGKLWFIEANAKPGKDTVALGCGEETFIESFFAPLEYAKLLAGFKTAPLTDGTSLSSPAQLARAGKGDTFSAASVPHHQEAGKTVMAVETIPVVLK